MAAEVRVHRVDATSALLSRVRVHRLDAQSAAVAVRVHEVSLDADPIAAAVRVLRLSAVATATAPGDAATLQRRAGQWVPRQLLTRVDGAWL